MAHVLVSPLNWGLGHATRDIPIIKNLLDHHHDVTVAACGNALSVLEKEFPDCQFINFPDYPVPYSASRFFLPKFVAFFPLMLRAVSDERKKLDLILGKKRYDLIISDNRLGVYSLVFWPVELLAVAMNGYLHGKFRHIIVPDNPPGPTALAGKLSRPGTDETKKRVYYSGILTSTHTRDIAQDLDYLVMISGPEPQRTQLEKILLPQVSRIEGNSVILLGSPDNHDIPPQSGNCRVITYASTREKEDLMNRAKFIICRSGYTSIMEIAELGKQHALFIPTPGQTEQEYLSWYYEKKGWFHSQSQYLLDLPGDIRLARQPRFTGFPAVPKTGENTDRLYDQILSPFLE
jgi:hypothetical protein